MLNMPETLCDACLDEGRGSSVTYGQMLYLLSDASRLTIKQAAFSAAEVAAITRVFSQEMKELRL